VPATDRPLDPPTSACAHSDGDLDRPMKEGGYPDEQRKEEG